MSLDASAFALALREPLPTAAGTIAARRGFLLRVGLEGLVGLGEATPLPPWTEDLKACRAALDAAAEHLDGLEDPEEALTDLDAFCKPLRAAPAARHGLALALLDLAARRAGLPLAAHLARSRPGREAALPARVPLNALVGALPPAAAAAAAKLAAAEGFRCVKLKLGGAPEEDLARALAVREAVGPDVELRLDANGAWTPDQALARLGALRAARPAYVEQPVPAGDVPALAAVRAAGLVPVAADEAAATLAGARRVLAARAADVVVVKPHALGGPDRALEVLAEAEAAGVRAVVTSLLDGPVALAGARHVAALLPEPRPACGLLGDLFEEPLPGFAVRGGAVEVPARPGLGLGGA